jgi:hypothetical protein
VSQQFEPMRVTELTIGMGRGSIVDRVTVEQVPVDI